MTMGDIPPYDFSKLDWRTSTTDPRRIYRDLSGGELQLDLTNRLNNRDANIFLVTLLSMQRGVSRVTFHEMAIESWAELRSAMPIIAAMLEGLQEGEEGRGGKRTCLTYAPPKDDDDARVWASRTVRVYDSTQDLEEARYDLGKKRIPEDTGDGTVLYIVPQSSEASYGIILHTDHVPFDGSGVKILMTRFLTILARHVGRYPSPPSKFTFKWGDETHNITPSAFQILVDEEYKEGPKYEQSLAEALTRMFSTSYVQYGFKTDSPAPNPGPTRHISSTFSAEVTEKLRGVAKKEGKTLNQIAHAALCLLCIQHNSPNQTTDQDAALVFPGAVNRRSQLLPEYQARLAYPGNCVTITPMLFSVSTLVDITKKHHALTIKDVESKRSALLEVASIIKAEYTMQKNLENSMAITPQLLEIMIASTPGGMQEALWISPVFIGDGIGETYLDPTYEDSSRRAVIDVQNFFLSINYQQPGPSFRAWSWRDRLIISADYNENLFKKDTVEGLMIEWGKWIESLV